MRHQQILKAGLLGSCLTACGAGADLGDEEADLPRNIQSRPTELADVLGEGKSEPAQPSRPAPAPTGLRLERSELTIPPEPITGMALDPWLFVQLDDEREREHVSRQVQGLGPMIHLALGEDYPTSFTLRPGNPSVLWACGADYFAHESTWANEEVAAVFALAGLEGPPAGLSVEPQPNGELNLRITDEGDFTI